MHTKNDLFLNGVKWLAFEYQWLPIPCLYCATVLGLSACTSMPDSTLQYKDGILYACVKASHQKEDKCYKVVIERLPPKGINDSE